MTSSHSFAARARRGSHSSRYVGDVHQDKDAMATITDGALADAQCMAPTLYLNE